MIDCKKILRIWLMGTVGVGGLALMPAAGRADDYTDLLEILKAKGSLTSGEYRVLMAKHVHRVQMESTETQSHAREQRISSRHGRQHGADGPAYLIEAKTAADRAAASAAAAQQALQDARIQFNTDSKDVVKFATYVPGQGITFHAGPIDFNISGFVNGFYTFNSPSGGPDILGALSQGGSRRFDSSSIRNGFLPAGLILKMNTTQRGIDLAAVFGMYPGTNNAAVGTLNANSGGSSVALGTPGIDFRQIYMTAGNKKYGTFKVGRDLGIFGSDAILSDATLTSVGITGNNAAPSNTSLGRIGVGYIYADWLPQISYASPVWKGVQATVGVMTPLDEYNFAGGDVSATSTQHSSPMAQAKVTYDFAKGPVTGRVWAGFMAQHQQNLKGSRIAATETRGAMATAEEVGGKINYAGFQGVAYYYHGSGVGTTGLFFDGIANNGAKRNSEGYYVQVSYNPIKRLRIVGSYGVSNLYNATGDDNPLLIRRNEAEIGALYLKITDWLTLITEYEHSASAAHGPYHVTDNAVSGGAVLNF
ncbi:MAG: porin [Acetobacter sp.]|jgi:hypothetical protein|nr:porin [Acetobacter sp.]MCH4060839.1 porin [Acetobacter sp.]MCH4087779.1 porin [Acetobacter sp.]MCI1293704.1 porin [Acetobacter sp.]MCI1319889.1 porin [Acetobacter sp.]